MFKICNRCRTASVSLRRFSTFHQALPEFKTNNKLRNAGLWTGAAIATAGAYYYMKSDEALYNVEVGNEVLRSESSTGITEVEVRRRIKSAYGYVLGGLGVTSASAFAFYRAGLPILIARTNPWVFLGVSLATSIPLMVGTMFTDYNASSNLKHALWCGFHVSMAGGLSILGYAGGPILAQAALATGCVVGGLSLLASKASPGSLQKYEAPLGMGLGGLVAVGLGNMIFPMPIMHNVMLYGGLAIFSGLLLTDTRKLLDRAQNKASFDPINESLGIYLDTINIFQKIVLILWDLENQKKRK